MGDIGKPLRHIELEPLENPQPARIPEPTVAPQPEPVPA